MGPIVNINNRGFTLIEFMAAMIIMSIGLLGLMQTVNYALHHNLENEYRREATLIADEKMAREKTRPFAIISTVSSVSLEQRKIYNGFKNFSVARTGITVTNNTKQVEYEIRWRNKDKRFSHSIVSLLSQQAE
jgi:type IV pilus assembly protein PilV